MNHIDFDKTGGFPLETETLDEMQKAYKLLQSLGDIVGEKSIIKGCNVVGSTITDGIIYLNGELLEFRGGAAQSKIIIVDEPLAVEFEDGDTEDVYHTRYATFGTGINAVNWSEFTRAYPLTSALFVDEVRMYAGDIAKIPWGWYLMDGTNGTMDLRDKFPVPYNPDTADYDAIGKTGGLNDVTLTKGNLPDYDLNHNLVTVPEQVPSKYIGDDGDGWPDGHTDRIVEGDESSYVRDTEVLTIPELAINGTISSGGSSESLDNRPAFKVVGFIQFKGV